MGDNGAVTRTVSLLGSTGSIGTQALEVIARHPGAYDVAAIAAFYEANKSPSAPPLAAVRAR